MIYLIKSPVTVDEIACQYGEVGRYPLSVAPENVIRDLVGALASEMQEMSLVEYIHDENLRAKIAKIVVSIQDHMALTSVETVEDLSSTEQKSLLDYITGQFSDGWGEGFEQRAFSTYRDTFTEEVEEEDEDGDITTESYDYEDVVELFAHFWSTEGFTMTIESLNSPK